MREEFIRTEMLFGNDKMEILKKSHVIVFGVGGVGGHVVETLARAGVGSITIVDKDVVSVSNINRQIIALQSTVGQAKVDVMKARIKDINPQCNVETFNIFYLPETKDIFDFTKYDYVVDAIDTVTGKIQLVLDAGEAKTPIISSMGTGNKLKPEMLEVSDIYKTSVCPLAKVMRKELKKRHVPKLKVVYSKEQPQVPLDLGGNKEESRRSTPGSTSFVPSVAGIIIASEVVKDLTKTV